MQQPPFPRAHEFEGPPGKPIARGRPIQEEVPCRGSRCAVAHVCVLRQAKGARGRAASWRVGRHQWDHNEGSTTLQPLQAISNSFE
eukprot:13970684-Alexandrium_andersonii.AAC.1